jgi:hypothetical protein
MDVFSNYSQIYILYLFFYSQLKPGRMECRGYTNKVRMVRGLREN